jgi:hypothetical protein
VLTLRGLVTYYVLFFIHLESRRVDIAGITIHPGELWMKQIARHVTMEGCGVLRDCRYLLHDRDTKYTQSFRTIIASGRPLALPARRNTDIHREGAVQCRERLGGSCVITIKKRREMAGKSWMSPVKLVVELRLRNDDYDCWQMHKRIIAELRLRDRSVER